MARVRSGQARPGPWSLAGGGVEAPTLKGGRRPFPKETRSALDGGGAPPDTERAVPGPWPYYGKTPSAWRWGMREHGLVFASTIGTPIEPRNVNRRWDELRRKADLDWLRLHDLRHGCATSLLAQGVPARAIMEVLGHAEIGVTMNTYAHVLPVLRQEAADAIDELFGA